MCLFLDSWAVVGASKLKLAKNFEQNTKLEPVIAFKISYKPDNAVYKATEDASGAKVKDIIDVSGLRDIQNNFLTKKIEGRISISVPFARALVT